ncbi:hypothetical protein COT82_02030 [Candidatus Campbellbacteria bacterium CG10_big_fil_rev_8_21_14_0_10_35_52]|uniref:Uncharacterized protein n=1 Tax=Candidatus Campbellbacteria bacterium CG10_big_fil_rev_8_21_14_0_10_35_52 TaxID=1974527 RepID=A0A2M6WV61_9BACT|nr:MAG: hypothetical protein COT82_02030 [Candidatus Campbellbacteria bacterium CG10_big_fil_rev_8_21_14_0_10_35_52]
MKRFTVLNIVCFVCFMVGVITNIFQEKWFQVDRLLTSIFLFGIYFWIVANVMHQGRLARTRLKKSGGIYNPWPKP